MNESMYNSVQSAVQDSVKNLKELEDIISFRKARGDNTSQAENELVRAKSQVRKDVAALKERGYTVDLMGVNL